MQSIDLPACSVLPVTAHIFILHAAIADLARLSIKRLETYRPTLKSITDGQLKDLL